MALAQKNKSGKGTRPPPGGKAFAVIGWLALLVILPAALYMAHVVQQGRENEVRNLRLLAQAANRVETVLRVSAENLAKRMADGVTEDFLRNREPKPYPYLELTSPDADVCTDADSDHAAGADSTANAEASADVGTATDADSGGAPCQTCFCLGEASTLSQRPLYLRHGDWSFEVDLAAILEDLPLYREPRPFEQLVLVDGDGTVLLQPETVAGLSPSFRLNSLKGLKAVDAPEEGEESAIKDLRDETVHSEVWLAGTKTHLLCQPLQVSLAADRKGVPENTVWALCGLSGSSRQIRHALGVAPQLGLALLLTIVYLICAWPFVKLFLMDRQERFLIWDGYLLWISTFACLSLTAVLLIDFDFYRAAMSNIERELEEVAEQVEEGLESVTNDLIGRLESADDKFDGRCIEEDSEGRCEFEHLLSGDIGLELLSVRSDDTYVDGLTSIFWIDKDGHQTHKGTVFNKNTPFVNLEHREYFRAARDEKLWPHWEGSAKSERACSEFYLQPLLSFTTGEREVVLSCRSDLEGSIAVALTAQPDPLFRGSMPPGFEFAVVDRDGQVLFHSDPTLALVENLFDEVSKRSRVRSAVHSGADAHFASHYQTRPHLLYGRPLEHFPWYVVVFYELETLRTANLEALGHTALVALPYLLIPGLVLLVFGVWRREAHWLWPDKSRKRLYWWLCTILALALAYELVWFLWGDCRSLWPFLVIPWTAMAAVIVSFALLGKRQKDSRVIDKPRLYHAVGLLLWLAVAIVPSLGFFKVAWLKQMESLAHYQARGLAETLAERDRRLDLALDFIGWADAPQREARRRDLLDVYSSVPAGEASVFRPSVWLETTFEACHVHDASKNSEDPEVSEDQKTGLEELWRSLARYLPIYNRSAEGLRYLATLSADDHQEQWRRCAAGFCLRPVRGDPDNEPFLFWAPRETGAPGLWQIPVGLLIGLLLGTVLLAAWVFWAAGKIFALDIPGQFQGHLLEENGEPATSRIVHLADPRQHQELVENWTSTKIDLTGPDARVDEQIRKLETVAKRPASAKLGCAAQNQKSKALKPEPAAAVLCFGFETSINDAKVRAWKLEKLHYIVFECHCNVVLPMVWNPFEQLFALGHWTPSREGQSSDAAGAARSPLVVQNNPVPIDADEAWRWGYLLSHFEVWPIRMRVPECSEGTKEDFKKCMEEEEGLYWALWNACSDDERITLLQVTEERFLNPNQLPTARGLLQRDLLLRRPELRPYHPCFEAFIRRVHEPQEVRQAVLRWERNFEGLGWRQLRWAFVSVLAVLGLFLTAVAPELLDATIGYLSAIAVVPAVLKLLISVRRTGTIGTTS